MPAVALPHPPPARALHSLTLLGHNVLMFGGVSADVGPCCDAFLLHQPALTQGLQAQLQLQRASSDLVELRARRDTAAVQMADCQLQLRVLQQEMARTKSDNTSLASKLQKKTQQADELREQMVTAKRVVEAAEKAVQKADLGAVAHQRRLQRAREGGLEMADYMQERLAASGQATWLHRL